MSKLFLVVLPYKQYLTLPVKEMTQAIKLAKLAPCTTSRVLLGKLRCTGTANDLLSKTRYSQSVWPAEYSLLACKPFS